MTAAKLILEDGTLFEGHSFGAQGINTGEVVFTTSMTGYPESLTDPSYRGQILVATQPIIGNYGICSKWLQSDALQVEGFAVRELSNMSHRKVEDSLSGFLAVPGISGIDTRALTKTLRLHGVMGGVIANGDYSEADMRKALKQAKRRHLVNEASTKKPYTLNKAGKSTIVVIDCGVKRAILDSITSRGCRAIVVPYGSKPQEIIDLSPDGILISNGPGDPKDVPETIKCATELMYEFPMLGICLGHQILALAGGADTLKLKFGHRGSNHAVKDLATGKVEIVSQNHGYAVCNLENTKFMPTKTNLIDGTNEGMGHKRLPLFSVQYHPEASPGPHDSRHTFDRFVKIASEFNAKK